MSEAIIVVAISLYRFAVLALACYMTYITDNPKWMFILLMELFSLSIKNTK